MVVRKGYKHMSISYEELNLKGKLVVQADRKINFLMGPIKSYYDMNNISLIMDYAKCFEKLEVQKNRILYQSRDGKSMSDSPYAIFKYLMESSEFNDYIHIWACESNEVRKYYKKRYKHLKNVEFVVIHGKEYLKELSICKYLINNSSFSIYFTAKPEQVYINTWHGTPLKYMGLDLENSLLAIQNLMRNFFNTSYMVTQNRHTTDIFKRAYQLDGLYDGEFIEDGYPRTDLTLNTSRKKLEMILKKDGVKFTRKKNLLFAPTYRGHFMEPSDDIEQLVEVINQLERNTDYNILLKVHPFLYDNVVEDDRLKKFLIKDTYDPNEILSIADLLITDYSSIFFDFLVTDKPIIFYTSDYEKYKNERGLYIDVDQLPGPTVTSVEELIFSIKNESFNQQKYKSKYNEFKERFTPYDDGKVTERLVNRIFKLTPNKIKKSNKERVLIYAGGLMNNGITSSLLNLLENIDYNRFEVIIFMQRKTNKIVLDNLNSINKNVKIILRSGGFFATFNENYRNIFVRKRGMVSKIEERVYPKKAYKREFRRLFGNSKFDYVIDFSGYSMFWSNLLLATDSKKKFVYLHSDMNEDLVKVVGNKRPHIINLKGLMTLYPKFDKLVNVSENIHKINEKKLKRFKPGNKFVTVSNSLDLKGLFESAKKQENIIKTNEENKSMIIANSPTGVEIINFDESKFNIFACGRLSPEKGFDNLIEGFSEIANEYPNAMLYILGEGKERTILETLIHNLGLSERVYLLGHQSNPFSLINKSDLFVLSSHYEGQGLVLLECLALNKNILSADLEVTREILDNGRYGMLKNNDAKSLAEGMKSFLEGDNPSYEKYNIESYNANALNQFYSLFE